MKRFVLGFTIAAVAVGACFTNQLPASADTVVEERTEQGPAQVLDSWMEPSVVRTREVKTEGGESAVIHEPLIMERHERVVMPTTETRTTTTVTPPSERVVEKQVVVAKKTSASFHRAKKKVTHKRHARKRHVAYRKPVRKFVAQRSVERVETRPATIEQTEQTVERSVIYERKHPALDLY